jgi:hypothetical protein
MLWNFGDPLPEIKTVLTRNAQFEEHPEAYRPRVFVTILSRETSDWMGEYDYQKSYIELLQDGQAVTWPSLPNRETCGFDYWSLTVQEGRDTRLGNVTMIRQSLPVPVADWGNTQSKEKP